jgi:RNA polymerase sigma factor (sigma-70 family)
VHWRVRQRFGLRAEGTNIIMGASGPALAPTTHTNTSVFAEDDHQAREHAILLAVREGRKEALGVLYKIHRPDALAFARSLVRNSHDAEDIFHEAFTKTINAITNGAGPSDNFPAYLNTALRATAASWWKRNIRELPTENTALDLPAGLDPRLEAVTDHHRGHEHVLTALQTLPERWQKVLWYTDVLQQKPRETAPLLGITPNAVSALVLRARKGLRVAYADLLRAPTQTQADAESGPDD